MLDASVKQENKVILENKSKIVLVHSSSGHKHALQEVLADEGVMRQLSDTKYAKGTTELNTEQKAMSEFFKILSSDPCRAFYGFVGLTQDSNMCRKQRNRAQSALL
jgi:protein pelota